jgi:hypothetical protein
MTAVLLATLIATPVALMVALLGAVRHQQLHLPACAFNMAC